MGEMKKEYWLYLALAAGAGFLVWKQLQSSKQSKSNAMNNARVAALAMPSNTAVPMTEAQAAEGGV